MTTFLGIVYVTFLLLILVFAVIIVVALRVVRGNAYSSQPVTTTTTSAATSKSSFKWLREQKYIQPAQFFSFLLILAAVIGLIYLMFPEMWTRIWNTPQFWATIIALFAFCFLFRSTKIGLVILGILLAILVWNAIPKVTAELGYVSNPPATVPAKPVVSLPPLYEIRHTESFQITAPKGDPVDPRKGPWSKKPIVLPYYCLGDIVPTGEVWIKDENGQLYENGPASMGYQHWDFPSSVHYVWYQGKTEDVVVNVHFCPLRHR